jgi:hypothetical protein
VRLTVVVDEAAVTEMLVAAGLLAPATGYGRGEAA